MHCDTKKLLIHVGQHVHSVSVLGYEPADLTVHPPSLPPPRTVEGEHYQVLGQSPRHNICTFIELPCYLNCLLKLHILC